MKRHIHSTVLLLTIFLLSSCALSLENQKKDYGVLESAVMFSSDKVIGEYGDVIPQDFNGQQFLNLVRNRIPDDYYSALKKYNIEVDPRGAYYLLKVFDKQALILFDYSCTPEVDGPILISHEKYDLDNLDKYDTCR